MILNVPGKCLTDILCLVAANEGDLINELVAFFLHHCRVTVHDTVKIGNKSSQEIADRVENAIWRRDNYLDLLMNQDKLMEILTRCEHFQARPHDLTLAQKIWKRLEELFQVLSVDPVSEPNPENLPFARTKEMYDAKAKEMGRWIDKLFGNNGITTYLHILVMHCGDLIATGFSFVRWANYDIEGKHAVIRRTSRSTFGQPTLPKRIVANDASSRGNEKKLSRRRRERESEQLQNVGATKRGRKKSPESKKKWHTNRTG